MKKVVSLVSILVLAFNHLSIKAQNSTIGETIDSINTLLKTNPYVDNFLEITIYYTVDISSDNELVVTMESPGSYKTVFKAKFSDLNNFYQKDSCNRTSNTISWHCKSEDLTINNSCVYVEGTIPGGGEANYHQDNIIVMFSNRNQICRKLYNAFNCLFTKVLESVSK